MKFDNLLRYALRIQSAYTGEIPLHRFLANFFRDNPQMGSRDRKQVTEMLYCFFRLGHTLREISVEERILTGLFLCNDQKEPLLEYLRPEWHELVENSTEEKIEIVRRKFADFNPLDIFPWKDLLSKAVDHAEFCLSFLKKPRLFIRVRPGFEKSIRTKLETKKIAFIDADPDSILPYPAYSFNAATRLDDAFILNREAVVQDLVSQQTALYLKTGSENEPEIWDCCSGSGGKTILLADLYPGASLTVSDIRESILKNLAIRFHQAGIQPQRVFRADLTNLQELPRQLFSYIVADLPCTGSGTWSRSPEALYYFNPSSIDLYRQRQEKILSNIISQLKPGGTMVYITCSVFAGENEGIVQALGRILNVENQAFISGYHRAADSMYVARFRKQIAPAV